MDDLETVTALDERWNRAYRAHDAAPLEDVFAPDWVGLFPDGGEVARDEMLARTVTNPPGDLRFTRGPVRLFGDTATVQGHLLVVLPDGTQHEQRFLRVYARRGGAWRAVVAQVIPAGGHA